MYADIDHIVAYPAGVTHPATSTDTTESSNDFVNYLIRGSARARSVLDTSPDAHDVDVVAGEHRCVEMHVVHARLVNVGGW
jgi:hypothetical protein